MTTIKGFKGTCYNPEDIADLSSVICPPYDVINDDERHYYYQKSPYNFIHLILNRPQDNDNDSCNRYSRANVLFNEWIKNKILSQDKKEAMYFYKQDFFFREKEVSRLGFISLMDIGNAGSRVFPHENTRHAPKMDRFELIKNVKANLTPIFTIFSDRKMVVEDIFKSNFVDKKPDISVKDDSGVRHSLWKLSDREMIKGIRKEMVNREILIADGHHRFEVACMYLELMKQEDKSYSSDKSYNFIMTYFTPLESQGICIFPVHRLTKNSFSKDLFESCFKMKSFNSIHDLEQELEEKSKDKFIYGYYDQRDILLLELKNRKDISKYVQPCFNNLDVAILDFYIFAKILNVKKDDVSYTHNLEQAKELVDNKDFNSVFILRPAQVSQVKDIALSGEKMPPKSTYFYPKLASGLVVHKFED